MEEAVETLDDHALLDLIEQALAALGAQPLDGQVDDTTLAESIERLHRVETVAAALAAAGRRGRRPPGVAG
ncbi:MAG: hypothetical protein ACRDYX_05925 [Egibacteraceae bacterium]